MISYGFAPVTPLHVASINSGMSISLLEMGGLGVVSVTDI
ncbi:hypothetical protein FB472_1662 [Rhodoglobus vestalii]|uniref:Uncharacterized protein n=1 Tax=Rhodoglobus vestalii TaxID=193384 RepID=A0A8H2K6W9_9MICO|nr:hypothetical protein FB472_1662 [Rhodoglobus vestalii]